MGYLKKEGYSTYLGMEQVKLKRDEPSTRDPSAPRPSSSMLEQPPQYSSTISQNECWLEKIIQKVSNRILVLTRIEF